MEAKHTAGPIAAKTVGYLAKHPQKPARLIKRQRAAHAYQHQYIDGIVTLTPVIEATPEVVRACNAHDELVAALQAVRPYVNAGEAIVIDAALVKAGAA